LKTKKAIIFTDGAAEPNPGPAAIGAIIKDGKGRLITSISRHIGTTTNNQAEYYRVKNAALKPLYQQVKQLQSLLEGFTITHIPREQNTEADKLTNAALDLIID